MKPVNETMVIQQDLLEAVLQRSWTLDLPKVEVFRGSDAQPVRTGPGRVVQDADAGQLWLEITAHSEGIAQHVAEMNAMRAGTVIGPDRQCHMRGWDVSGVEWRSAGFIEGDRNGGFFPGGATYRYRLDEVCRGPREPAETIRDYVVIFDGHLPIPMSHASHIVITDGCSGSQSSHTLRNRLHFDTDRWSRQLVHRLGGHTECLIVPKGGMPEAGSGLLPYTEELVVQAVTVAFQTLCDWVVCYFSTAATQTVVVRSLPLREHWRSNFPLVAGNAVPQRFSEPLLAGWFDALSAAIQPPGWDMRARVAYSMLKNEQAKAEVPTQLLVIGAGIETIARQYFQAKGFDPRPALAYMDRVITAVRAGSIPEVPAQFGDRLNGFKQMMSSLSAKELFRASNPGTQLDFSEAEIKAWSDGRNAPAHGKWPTPDEGMPWLYAMITMMHKALLRTIDWKLPLTDYSPEGWPLIEPPAASATESQNGV